LGVGAPPQPPNPQSPIPNPHATNLKNILKYNLKK